MIVHESKVVTSKSQLGDGELCCEFHEGLAFGADEVTVEVTTSLDVILYGRFSYVQAYDTVNDGIPQLYDKVITTSAVTCVRKAHAGSAQTFDGFLWGYKTGS
jgi:hypothetical protein